MSTKKYSEHNKKTAMKTVFHLLFSLFLIFALLTSACSITGNVTNKEATQTNKESFNKELSKPIIDVSDD